MKTLIAIPCMDTIRYETSQSLIYMHKGDDPTVLMKPNSLIYDSRNLISLYAIENNYDQVMWFDSDMVFPPDTLLKLQAHDAGVVTGLYVTRHDPCEPVLYDVIEEPVRNTKTGYLEKKIHPYTDFPRDSYFKVDGCGFGCVLTKTSVLKKVWNKFGPAFHPFPWAGEDISFCYRLKLLGIPIWCDSSVSCGHIGTKIYTELDLKKHDGR